jgi:hypothetical protein
MGEPGGEDGNQSHSTAWTGIESASVQIKRTRALLPVAQQALETLIAHYETGGHNGGPPMGDREEALQSLKDFHGALGAIISAIDSGSFDDGLGEGMIADALRCAGRVAKALKDDPVPFVGATMTAALLSALGLGEVGGILSGAILTGKKPKPKGGHGEKD